MVVCRQQHVEVNTTGTIGGFKSIVGRAELNICIEKDTVQLGSNTGVWSVPGSGLFQKDGNFFWWSLSLKMKFLVASSLNVNSNESFAFKQSGSNSQTSEQWQSRVATVESIVNQENVFSVRQ